MKGIKKVMCLLLCLSVAFGIGAFGAGAVPQTQPVTEVQAKGRTYHWAKYRGKGTYNCSGSYSQALKQGETGLAKRARTIHAVINGKVNHSKWAYELIRVHYGWWEYSTETLSSYTYSVRYSRGKTIIDVSPTYVMTPAQEKAVKNKAASIVKKLKLKGTNYQKVKKINSFLAKNCVYGYQPRTAYNNLIDHVSNCEGYATAFYLLCQKAHIPCHVVMGNAYSDGSWGYHAWSLFKSGRDWYTIDTCWNDAYGGSMYWCKKGFKMKDHIVESWYAKQLKKLH